MYALFISIGFGPYFRVMALWKAIKCLLALSILFETCVLHLSLLSSVIPKYFTSSLTLFPLGGGGLFDPLYHESVYRIYRTRTRFTKIDDFVPFGICQDPVKLLLKFFSKKFEILDVKIFWGSSSIRKKWKNFENFFFEKKAKI